MKQIDPILNLGCNIWKTDKCFDCSEPYKKPCWYVFENIGNKTFQVPICDKCSNKRDENFSGLKETK